jgi:hypothetical protein
MKDLRDSLLDNYNKMKSKEMDLKEGKELSNCAGKVIQSIKVELEYQALTGNIKEIDFLK